MTAPWWSRVNPITAGCLVAVALVLWASQGVWGGRPPAGEDVMAHLVRVDFGISELVTHGRLDGWLPRFYVGYQEFLFNGPGFVWAVAAVRGLTFGLLSDLGALKVTGVLSLAAVPVSVAFFARSVALGRLAAGIAAVLSLLVSNIFGVGLQGMYSVGLLSHQVGAPLFFVALGALLRVPVDARRRWIVVAAVAVAGLAVTHLISVMVLAVFYPLLAAGLLRRRPEWDALVRLGVTAAAACGLAAWWLLPAVAHRDLSGAVATWGTPSLADRLYEVANGGILFRPYTVWIVFIGWAYAIVRLRDRKPFALTLVVAPVAYLVFAHWAAERWPGNDFTLQLANRGLGYAGVIALLPAAAALADAATWATGRLRPSTPVAAPVCGAAALGVAALLVLSGLGPDRAVVAQLAEPAPELRAAAEELARVVPDDGRFATERDYPDEISRLGIIQPANWLTAVSGRRSLNGFNLESSSTTEAALEPERIGKVPAADIAASLGRLGVTHVVAVTDHSIADFDASDRFRPVWRQGTVAIYELVRPRGAIPYSGDLTGRVLESSPEHLRVTLDPAHATTATLGIAWSPKWHATIDDRAVPVRHTPDGLIDLTLPSGRVTVDLTYDPDNWDRLGVAISFLTLAAISGWTVMAVRKRRRGLGAARSSERGEAEAPPV